jgi:hypothetical protein
VSQQGKAAKKAARTAANGSSRAGRTSALAARKTDQPGRRGATSARTHARNRGPQADPARRSSSSTERPTSSARTGKNSLMSAAW